MNGWMDDRMIGCNFFGTLGGALLLEFDRKLVERSPPI